MSTHEVTLSPSPRSVVGVHASVSSDMSFHPRPSLRLLGHRTRALVTAIFLQCARGVRTSADHFDLPHLSLMRSCVGVHAVPSMVAFTLEQLARSHMLRPLSCTQRGQVARQHQCKGGYTVHKRKHGKGSVNFGSGDQQLMQMRSTVAESK
mmetsp:Transcript_36538/g.97338  ORF Transcript_36538/g.97338 Transcript_36538/m.97338 type:complete len:151 (-) Transcript_36538:1558-2010(-)